jgi:hypothetical protein
VKAWGLLLLLLAGCSGPPLKELPVLEPPPEPPVEKTPERTPAVALPPAPQAPARLEGAWRSREMEGPGSGAYLRIDFIFEEDGAYVGIARAPKKTAAIAGTFERVGGEIVLQGQDGRRRVWSCSVDEHRLVLKEGPSSLVLERLR